MSPSQPNTDADAASATELSRLLRGYQLSQALSVAASLKIADHLAAGAHSAEELAQRTGAHLPSLIRLLRTLAACGVVLQQEVDHFTLAPLGDALRVDAPNSLYALAIRHGSEQFWRSWGDLLHCVQTGESAMSHLYDAPNPFVYYAQHPEVGAQMAAGFTVSIQMAAYAVLAAYDFSRYRTVVDIGGGQGQLLGTILQAYPAISGVLFDAPSVTQQQAAILREASIAARCTIVSGDFFATIPSGGDLYILSRIIHDWDDAQAIAILGQIRRTLTPSARLLLIEAVLPDIVEHSRLSEEIQLSDLNMLVRTGGSERTETAYRQLLGQAGFAVTAIIPTSGAMSLLEAVIHEGL